MSALPNGYAALLLQFQPEVISDQAQNQIYLRRLEALTSKKSLNRGERKLVELLTLLIEDFERKSDPVHDATPIEVVRHLMEAHDLRQKDLTDVFGSESIVSEVLRGKRELTKDHIKRLSARFGVSPAVFF